MSSFEVDDQTRERLVDPNQVLRALRDEVQAAGPDYIYPAINRKGIDYPRCDYVRAGQPSCLIGRAFHRLGVPLAVLAEADKDGASGMGASLLWANLSGQNSFNKLAFLLAAIQESQDNGGRWGTAYNRGIDMAVAREVISAEEAQGLRVEVES